jgi:hypothetical protein
MDFGIALPTAADSGAFQDVSTFRYVHLHLECPAVVEATIVGGARFRYA